MTWATSQRFWERSRQSHALLGAEHGAEGQPRLPAQPRRNETRGALLGGLGLRRAAERFAAPPRAPWLRRAKPSLAPRH